MATNDRETDSRKGRVKKAKPPSFADVIRAEVDGQEWSARALATEADVPQPTVTRFLNGADIRLSNVEKLCKVLGLQLSKR
jgi:DNA-binding Xre family transcriptional regulator